MLGYPFHPPGKPHHTRVDPLLVLKTPCLILQGTRDPLGKPEEIESYGLPSSIELAFLEDGEHSFVPRKSSGRTHDQNMDEAIERLAQFLTAAPAAP